MRAHVSRFLFAALIAWYLIVAVVLLHRTAPKTDDGLTNLKEEIQRIEDEMKEQSNNMKDVKSQLYQVIQNHILSLTTPKQDIILPVLVLACSRPVYLERTLNAIIKYSSPQYLPKDVQIKLIVSQDCNKPDVSEMIKKFSQHISIWLQQPDQKAIPIVEKNKKMEGYYWLSRHFKFALGSVLDQHDYVIVIEDDLEISPDFFHYIVAGLKLMSQDSSIWCVSAWNDNGKTDLIENKPELLHRTDFFPGLGWLLKKSVWLEIRDRWPPAYWDDWMRQPEQRKGRSCIRPEISRTSTFGQTGTSQGQFFDKFLRFIQHAQQFVPFADMDLSYLLEKSYGEHLKGLVASAHPITFNELDTIGNDPKGPASFRIEYNTKELYKKIANKLGIMDDFKSGVPRTGYMGIVSAMRNNKRVYVTPPGDWKGYNITWS